VIIVKKLLSMFIAVCLLLPSSVWASDKDSPATQPKIIDLLHDETPLLEDGSIWTTFDKVPLHTNANLVTIAGSGWEGFGITKEGKLVYWSVNQSPEVVPDVNGVKQVGENYWLSSDGTLWEMDRGEKKQREDLVDIVAFDDYRGIIGAVLSSGEVKYYGADYSKNIDRLSDTDSIAKIQVTYKYISLLYKDGKVVLYYLDNYDFEQKQYKPEILATDGKDITFDSDTLLVVKKDGTVWRNKPTYQFKDNFTLVQIPGIDHIQKVVANRAIDRLYAYQDNGTWITYNSGKVSPLIIPSIDRIKFNISNSKPKLGDKLTSSLTVVYNDGDKIMYPLSLAQVTIDKPYLLQPLPNDTFKSLGVGEVTITIEFDGYKQSVKIVSGLKNALENAKQVNGVTYLPVKSVFQAMGGTVNYDASTKSFLIKVGSTSIVMSKGSAQAKVNDKPVTMKGVLFENKGETLFPAHLLSNVFGAKLNWNSTKQEMVVSLGAAQFSVKGEQTKNNATTKNSGKMYEVAATGDMAGWKILKGHPYENSLRIYFTYKNGIMSTKTEDIRKVNLNQKVTWIDDSGRKRTNTVGDIYSMFQKFSGEYTSEWLSKKFGNLYADWLLSSTVDATRIVEQYLQETGQAESSQYHITLTPDAVFE